jgi:putative hydrolase of the HAD superfamily
MTTKIKVLFTDLGGVLLTNGWDHESRKKAAAMFALDPKEFESRHSLMFGDYETGKITLNTYLHYTVFYEPRPFSYDLFVEFMYTQSQAIPEMIDLVKKVKKEHGLTVVAVSNEGRELTDFRINTFKLTDFIDFFAVSCFLSIRKPDKEVWEKALDFVQAKPEEVVYMEDRQLFVEIAKDMGIQAFRHKDLASTKATLEQLFTKIQ